MNRSTQVESCRVDMRRMEGSRIEACRMEGWALSALGAAFAFVLAIVLR